MVAMQQALRRDVLQWLVTLNLSFPIKNIKRDFSNGFLVAEILSRYYPHDVQMHSFDYGTKVAKKKDNWEQLKKIFLKEDFPFFHDEIDAIINCGPHDGVGPLLERLYGFLTHKRYKPMYVDDVDELWMGIPDATLFLADHGETTLNNDDHQFLSTGDHASCLLADPVEKNPLQSFDLFDTGDVHAVEGAMAVDGGVLLELGEAEASYLQEDDTGVRGSDKVHSIIQRQGGNAVEKARQKDKRSKHRVVTKTMPSIQEIDINTQRHASLAFRSPNRQRQFKSYTLKEYKQQQHTGRYMELGKLGPETTESLLSQRERLEKMKAFGRIARDNNVSQAVETQKPKEKRQSCREKAMEFASKLPKPKKKVHQKENVQDAIQPCSRPMTELEKLEAKHQKDRKQVEAIRRDLEIFIR